MNNSEASMTTIMRQIDGVNRVDQLDKIIGYAECRKMILGQKHNEAKEEIMKLVSEKPKVEKPVAIARKPYRWGDSPPPDDDSNGTVDHPDIKVIMHEQEKEKQERKNKVSVEGFCGTKGHKCIYTFRGSNDVAHYNPQVIEGKKLVITGLPKEVNHEYIREQIRESLTVKNRPIPGKIYVNEGQGFAFLTFHSHEAATSAFHELKKEQKAKTLERIGINFAARSK